MTVEIYLHLLDTMYLNRRSVKVVIIFGNSLGEGNTGVLRGPGSFKFQNKSCKDSNLTNLEDGGVQLHHLWETFNNRQGEEFT